MSPFCLIYLITNQINGKVYVGRTWRNLHTRFIEHCCDRGHSPYLSNSIAKYGRQNFRIELLTVCHTQEIANYWEQYFIERYRSTDRAKGYNLQHGGANGKHSEETKRKMSLARIGFKHTEEWKR